MKIYTKTGDEGTTGLFGGRRVSKSSPRIAAYGDIDELNAVLGVVIAHSNQNIIQSTLRQIQNHLFILGAQLASPSADPKIERITSAHIDFLERQIDVMTESLPPLTHFILPGGSKTAAHLHLARTVCRRAERNVVYLSQLPDEPVDNWVMMYINRLSDFLFVFSRLINQLEKVSDIEWVPQKR
ncbi:MAG: cob(I)yrinic acid a,c-diamide adenosyltransferase [Deltaproteobacteria bacterium]